MKTSDIVDLQVQTVRLGDEVTVKCDQKADKDDLVWYKQSLGKPPQYIVRTFLIETEVKHRFSQAFEN